MTEYACCFCGEAIDRTDNDALVLIAQNLWKRDPDKDAAQAVYAHSAYAMEHIAAGQLTPSALHDESNYSLQEIVWGENEGQRVSLPMWGRWLFRGLGALFGLALLFAVFQLFSLTQIIFALFALVFLGLVTLSVRTLRTRLARRSD